MSGGRSRLLSTLSTLSTIVVASMRLAATVANFGSRAWLADFPSRSTMSWRSPSMPVDETVADSRGRARQPFMGYAKRAVIVQCAGMGSLE